MAHIIDDTCISCGTCEPECAFEAISEGDDIFVISAEKCTDCGVCVDVCPTESIQAGE